MMGAHVVEDLCFEVDFASEDEAFEAQERLVRFAQERGQRVIGEVFDEERVDRKAALPANAPDLGGHVLVENVVGNGRGRFGSSAAVFRPAFDFAPFHFAPGLHQFRHETQKPAPGRFRRMLDLGQFGNDRPTPAQQFRKTAYAVEIGVFNENPLGLAGAGRDAAETNANVFVQLLTEVEPRRDRVVFRHIGRLL